MIEYLLGKRRCAFCRAVRPKAKMVRRIGLWFCGEPEHHLHDWIAVVDALRSPRKGAGAVREVPESAPKVTVKVTRT